MNLKCFMSRISAFFASLLFMVVFATESFAAMYLPGQVIEKFNYTSDVTFTAQYTAVVCDAGMYLPEGSTECVACPAGYYCLGGEAPVACPAGRYCLSGTQSANGSGLVAAGYYSTGGAKVQNPQSAEDCVGDDNACGLIDAGYWGAAGATISTGSGKVAAGYYNMGGGTSATPEVRGKGCVNVSTTQCGTVAPGYWGEAGATRYGGSGTVAPGYFSTGGATSRTPSASDCVGKVAIIENGKLMGASDVNNTCGQVQAGYWNNACGINATGGVCSAEYQGGVIAAGHWGTAGATDSAGLGLLTPGYYSTGGATSEFPNPNQCVGNNTCGAVAAGYWNNGGGTSANGTCVSGKSCGTVNGGYYSTGGGTSATPTAAGNGCLANKSCGTCANWTYSGAGASSCTACPAVESGYAKLDSTGTGWTTYQKCVEIATASPENCASGKLQKIPTASGATTWATATVNANNPLVAKPGYIVSGTACLSEGYVVSFETNGGSDVADMTCTVETADITLPTPTKTGYTFGGWYQNSALTGNALSVIAKGTCTSAYKLYAKWTVIERKITLNANGGTIVGGSSATPSACTVETADITLPKPTKTGYTFGGWYQDSALTGTAVTKIAKGACLSDYTLYAKWTGDTYTITLDANGGTGGETSVTATYGELLPTVTVPTMNGFAFNGYWTAAEGGVQYYNTQGVALKKFDDDSLGTLYAQWVADDTCAPGTYYDSTTGTLQTCPAGSYCPGKESGCEKIGCPSEYRHSVEGASEQGQCYMTKTRCSCVKNEQLCPGYSCSYNPVKFEGVVYYGTTACVASPDEPDEIYCPVISASCLGHLNNNNVGQYFNGDLVTGSCEICNFEGVYDGKKVVFYQSNQQETTQDNGSAACYATVSLPCTAPICPLKNTGACDYDSTVVQDGAGFLYYGSTVPRPGPGEVGFMCPGTIEGTKASFTCNTGYDKNENADINPTDGSASAPEDLCTPHVYTFTLNANGGETAVDKIYEKYSVGWYSNEAATAKITKVAVPVRPGYTFAGYYTKMTALEGGVRAIDDTGAILDEPDVTADTVLYAWWNVNTYTVKYNAAGASGTMDSVVHTCDEPLNLTPNAFTSATNDQQFIGWATEPNAATPEYTDGQKVVNLTLVNNAVVTLYPVWKACTACAAGKGATCLLTAPVGVCTYTTACAANYENLQNAGKYNPACSAIKYAVNMETDGGEISSDYTMVSQCTVESGVIVLPTAAQISREDYRFEGWYYNDATEGSSISSIPAGGCTTNKTLYAKWVKNVVTCTPGEYYNGTSFMPCPRGYYCPGKGKVTMDVVGCRTVCPSGYEDGGTGYSDESQCQISVPQGSYLATAKGTNTIVCPAGKYTSGAVLVSYGDTSSCASCEAGNYCSNGTKRSCATETDGVFASSVANSDNIDDCYTVTVAGKYIADNAVKTCVVPYYCPGDIKVSYGNSGGNLSCADLSDDVTWQSGVTASGESTPDKCYVVVADGKYWNGDAFATCKAGTYKTEHNVYYGQKSSCVTCPAGYTSEAGASECYLTTTAGKYVATAGKGEVECKAGDFCPGGVKVMVSGVGGNTACKTLADGKYSMSAAGTKSADMCYTESCALAINATEMSGKDYYGASVADTCVATLCKAGFTVDGGACSVCEANNVCNPAKDAGKPYTCSDLTGGVYTKSAAQTGTVDNCYLTTTAGKYVATAGKGEVECKAGDFCPGGVKVMVSGVGGNTACKTLAGGKYSMSATGTKSADMCYTESCALATNATAMSGKDYYGASVADTCVATLCKAGFTVDGGACKVCPADHVCDPANDNGVPHKCSDLTGGVYTKSAAQTGTVDNCYLTTTAGKYVATAGQGEVECLAGGYCAGGVDVKYTGTGGREACPADYAMSGTGVSEINQCYANCAMYSHATQMAGKDFYGTGVDTCEAVECETGFVLANGTCGSCPANSVCDPNYDGGKPHTCSELTNGKYTLSLENSSSIDGCYTITTPGKYVAVARQGEVACKVGDYCLGGAKVMYTATGGNSACSEFGADYSSDVGASVETQCYQRCALATNATTMSGKDYYGTEVTDTCEATLCKAGFTVDGGACKVCPADHVCDPVNDNGVPYKCSELTGGVYTKSAMQNGSVDNCYLITTSGKYVATEGQGEVDCLAGGYCAGGVKIMSVGKGGREVCPNGYALSDSGAASAQQCYTSCAMATNAQEMFGRDYYENGTDTCEITLCRPGYTLSDGVCKVCPANNICTPDIERGKPQLCSDLTKGTHKFAPAGSAKISDCYLKCEAYDITYGTAIPVSGTENYPLQCRFDGLSVTKNPCDIVNGTCVERSCNYNYEMIGGKCQACARENALSYKKDGGNCVVESCVSGFHPNGQACEVDTVECSVPNAVAATRVWDASKQAFGECVITECEEGYHLGANTCQADEQVCELEHGIGIREWNHKKNTWGDCIATKCDPGYTNDRSQTNELWKQCGRCNNMYSAGGELAASSYVDGCEIATCMYEGELYTLENNECVLICDTYSDETGSRRWNASRKKCERTCEPGYMSW